MTRIQFGRGQQQFGHHYNESDVAGSLGLLEDVRQGVPIPTAYYTGATFRPQLASGSTGCATSAAGERDAPAAERATAANRISIRRYDDERLDVPTQMGPGRRGSGRDAGRVQERWWRRRRLLTARGPG